MIDPPAPNRWTHSCLSDRVGLSLSEVHLNDRQKLSVLLQATCLESFLRELGQRVVGGWVGLTVDSEGLICGARTEPGISGETAQIWLSQLCERLFRTEGAPPGPGKARVGARRLLGYWAGFPTPMRPARAAGDLLDLVPELWSKKFATIRASLAGEIAYLERTDLWVVGNGSFKKQALSVADTYKDLCRWLASDGAREAWARSRSQYQRQAELTPSRRRSGTLSPIEIDEVSTPCFRPWSRARRSLGKQEAAAAWKRIALQRIGIRDLVGADRAICHALRLLGPAADMPVLLELQTLHIDFRIRRGFLADLSEILRRIEQAALRCDDPDIRFRFEILRSRFELNRGMPATALENLERSKSTTTGSSRDRSQALVVLQARCLGLLGQGDECRSLIDAFGPSHWRELEPEEQSAVWAQAGDLDAALSSSHGRPWERLWRQVADGGPIEEKDIRELKVLGEYRQA